MSKKRKLYIVKQKQRVIFTVASVGDYDCFVLL